ncbi:2-C-methyl-D-erythritol 4-phosphate cytidylyltransferase [Corynebacterium canis]|uniref:2-C-methyl-D-erythritol 4-phosphate cytidylyltransferase n=1 Tax=Corynebacterium canis TaxID=679663 RepID=A0A5C5UIM4_9CORY|nr:2-C-methyl-D-erythritol 4-phosphate cytidylyltransferase [Corynebacterium canis]TWT25533.1 2-C-methyl-D-erythritol 4-phosphate cytidylyltransferase [Corynebacterium canis]WJY76223.1 2-C-methyl-D-erythritol 4-phosphate cytidylyltransferase [Corynebacterium canis]
MTKTNPTEPSVTALVVAAGQGTRLGAGIPKAFVEVHGTTLVERSVAGLRSAGVTNIIVVVSREMRAAAEEAFGNDVRIVLGGAERMDSVLAGLELVAEGIVLIHDAARALTPPEMIRRVIAAAHQHAAVIPVLPVADTMKRVAGGVVVDTPDRSELRAVQTPQGFDVAQLKAAYAARPDRLPTDDASLMEWFGIPVRCVDGDALAFKVTTPLDLALARALTEGES